MQTNSKVEQRASHLSPPAVSVILPTYNRAASLGPAVTSVLKGTFPDFELIIVDDGSTDNTQEVIQAIMDPRILFLRIPERAGAAAARNLGVRHSRAPLIAFQDSDDAWDPSKLAIQLERLSKAGPQTGVVYSSFTWVRGDRTGVTPSAFRYSLSRSYIPRHRLDGRLQKALPGGNFISTQTALLRKEAFDRVGGFDERLPRFQDWDLWLRFAPHYRFAFIQRSLVSVVQSPEGISTDQGALVAAFHQLIEKYQGDKTTHRQLSAQYHYALAGLDLQSGKNRQGRTHLYKAIRLSPLTGAYWLAAAGAIFGRRSFRALNKFTRNDYG